jgi:hypothetical protein
MDIYPTDFGFEAALKNADLPSPAQLPVNARFQEIRARL